MKKTVKRTAVPALLSIGLLLSPLAVQAEMPYYGKDYSQPEKIKALYPEIKVNEATPAFIKGQDAFTTQEEMMSYVQKLAHKSPYVKLKIIGKSQQGRDIPALYFSKEKKFADGKTSKKPTIWLQSQIHGNEPASGESVLAVATRLTEDFGKDVLNKVNIVIVPRINPDGSYAFKRQLANNLDGNRDYIKLESPEVQSVRAEFNRFSPEVVIDAHEYTPYSSGFKNIGKEGVWKYHDILLQSGRNLNIPQRIRDVSDELFVNSTLTAIEKQGYSGEVYYTSQVNKQGQLEVEEGSVEPRIGRNSLGLYPSFSFLVESRGIGIGREDFPRRVSAQIATQEKLITQTAANAKQIKTLIAKEKAALVKKGKNANDHDPIVVNSENKKIPNSTLEMVDVESASVKKIPVTYYSAKKATPTLVRERPTAYILKPGHEELAEKLQGQGVKGFKLTKETALSVEAYNVSSRIENEAYENKPNVDVQTIVKQKTVTFPKGSYVFLTSQPQNNLLSLSLEPESVDSFTTFGYLPSEVGQELDVYRFTRSIEKSPLQKESRK
ncbi:M14 family metallopeptidase [Priestia megaterium]|uniref:M14 family metallopeptidase n=1 Tax=Priestia megaterium TaxID=1404 RepID=UPI0013E2DF6E|nr:M14 family metallopeptidase [Priestia megaterium]MED3863318.1 M14 family metallopeptidase [Priestia megaterium]MED4101729.1 M14 family metallopeptidase [Priestia megaterium]MED4145683.1 M14 family metallopeptidase [Priestia megaterium]MED4166472.1 M14 family metallopeptidase [Priestia megaterium]MED4199662.1 M14 family metallopeptidase [Priestia megaterium]